MKSVFIFAVFIFSCALIIILIDVETNFILILLIIYLLSGLSITLTLLRRLYFYSGVFLSFHILMASFAIYIFNNKNYVVSEQQFDFSVFTDSNIQQVVVNLVLVSALIAAILIFSLERSRASSSPKTFMTYFSKLLLRFESIPDSFLYFSVGLSFISALILFLTNSGVHEIPYPYQEQSQWVRNDILKIPTLLSVVGYVLAQFRSPKRPNLSKWKMISRLNFLIVTVLMLFLVGSRGIFTFLWLIFGLFELYLFSKKRGSVSWGVLFVVLSWISYISWPYLRTTLSDNSFTEAFTQAFLISIGSNGDGGLVESGIKDIRLNEFTMIGQSLFHFLYVVELVNSGISLHGTTFINLFPQLLPDFLDGVLFDRPINDNYRLSEYFRHGGGFLLVANAYWNGGAMIALLFIGIICTIFVGFDRRLVSKYSTKAFTFVYWLWLPIMIIQLGYGIQGFFRVVELLFVVILLEKVFYNKLRKL